MQLPFFEFSTFQVALYHSFVQFLSEFVKEICATVVLAIFHVHIDVVAVLDFYSEDFGKGISQFLYTDFSIVNTIASVKSIE
jgi:hypothetical protein